MNGAAGDARMQEQFGMHPLTSDERVTCQSMLQNEGCRVMLMPTHHINDLGDMMGFRFTCKAFASGNILPVVRTMFHGHTLVECQADEEAILRLMSQPEENQRLMREFLTEVEAACVPATLECAPENASAVTSSGTVEALGMLSVDSQHWTPELPDRIGIYHAYIRGFNRDVRTHRLFMVCSGGLAKASDAFCNLVIDVGKFWTAQEVTESQEAWWLRKACQRARCRLIKQLADKFGVPIQSVQDIQSHHPAVMAVYTSDTLEHDIERIGQDEVAVYNLCTNTTRHLNGIVANLHPSEGVWLFRGAPRANCFGSMFGDHRRCGVFPTSSPPVRRAQSITVQDSACIVRLYSSRHKGQYMCFDEAYFKTLEQMQWNRDNGFVELVPIVVGLP